MKSRLHALFNLEMSVVAYILFRDFTVFHTERNNFVGTVHPEVTRLTNLQELRLGKYADLLVVYELLRPMKNVYVHLLMCVCQPRSIFSTLRF